MTVLFHLAGNTAIANESLMRELACDILSLYTTNLSSLHRCLRIR